MTFLWYFLMLYTIFKNAHNFDSASSLLDTFDSIEQLLCVCKLLIVVSNYVAIEGTQKE